MHKCLFLLAFTLKFVCCSVCKPFPHLIGCVENCVPTSHRIVCCGVFPTEKIEQRAQRGRRPVGGELLGSCGTGDYSGKEVLSEDCNVVNVFIKYEIETLFNHESEGAVPGLQPK